MLPGHNMVTKLFLHFFLIFIVSVSHAQIHKIYYGDSMFMKPIEMSHIDPNTFQEKKYTGYIFKEDIHDGKWFVYFKEDSSKLWLEANFKNNRPIGKWEYWRLNGIREKQIYHDKDGDKYQLVIWNENGNKEIETMYFKDHFDGPMISWYDNGQMKSLTTYAYHKHNGISMKWYPNGQKEFEKFFHNNIKTGIWHYWNKEGSLVKEEVYQNDRLIKAKNY